MKIFTYVIPSDTGLAPNPYGGVMSLSVCKPQIRRQAQVGDWICGIGSACTRTGEDYRGRLVYIMRVTEKMTMKKYDGWAKKNCRIKIPSLKSEERVVGDSLYDFSGGKKPKIRKSLHGESSRKNDLSGEYTLLSEEFIYFGEEAIIIPEYVKELAYQARGHRSNANDEIKFQFMRYKNFLFKKYGNMALVGEPQIKKTAF